MYILLSVSKTSDSYDEDQGYSYDYYEIKSKQGVIDLVSKQDHADREIHNFLFFSSGDPYSYSDEIVHHDYFDDACDGYANPIIVRGDELKEIDSLVHDAILDARKKAQEKRESQRKANAEHAELAERKKMKDLAEKYGYKVVKDD